MEKKYINRILFFSSLILAAIVGVFIYYYVNPEKKNLGCGTKASLIICGNELTSPEKLKGKEIFNSNCAACHKMNARITPDLVKNLFEKIPNEEYFGLFITNEDSLQKANHKRVKKLREEFPNGFVHNFKFTKKEIEDLKKYLK